MTARAAVLAAVALTLNACDRLPWNSHASAVTVRVPPARTAAPGFAFAEAPKASRRPEPSATLR